MFTMLRPGCLVRQETISISPSTEWTITRGSQTDIYPSHPQRFTLVDAGHRLSQRPDLSAYSSVHSSPPRFHATRSWYPATQPSLHSHFSPLHFPTPMSRRNLLPWFPSPVPAPVNILYLMSRLSTASHIPRPVTGLLGPKQLQSTDLTRS